MKKFALLALSGAMLAVAAPAAAVTYTVSDNAADIAAYAASGSFTFDFQSATPEWNGSIFSPPDQPNVSLSPAGSAGNWASVQKDETKTLDLSALGPISSISFLLGSVDSYNYITLNGTGLGQTYQGTTLYPAANSSTGVLLTFNFEPGEELSSLTFKSVGANALEFDSVKVTTAVPEPATWAMMIGGFGLIGLSMRRRNRNRVAVSFA